MDFEDAFAPEMVLEDEEADWLREKVKRARTGRARRTVEVGGVTRGYLINVLS